MELESIRAYDAREHLAFNGRRIKEKAFRSLSGLLRGERQKFCVHGIIGARQTGASNEHEHQTQFS